MALIWCSTPPGFGHFGPLAPVAKALMDDGHDVRIVTSPAFAPVVERAGLVPLGLGRPWVEERVEEAFPECCADGVPYMSLVFEAAAATILEPMLEEAARNRPDLIIWIWPVDYAGAVAAAALDVPSLAIGTSAILPLDHYAWFAAGPLDRLRQGLGLSEDPDLQWLADVPHVTFFPPSLDPTTDHQVPIHRVQYDALDTTEAVVPPQVEALIKREEPLVLATVGTVYNRRGLLPVLLEAVANEPYNVVLATGATVASDDLPDHGSSVVVVPWVPFSQLIGHCDLVVHHGGTNTTLRAARKGVPTVVIPLGADQPTNSTITSDAGLSRVITEIDRTASKIKQAVTDVLADAAYRERAAMIAAEIAQTPTAPTVVSPLVDQLLSGEA